MKKILLATCCVAFLGGIGAASAQQMSPGMTSSDTGMNANARMSKKEMMMMKKKKMMMRKKSMMMKKGGMSDGMGMKRM